MVHVQFVEILDSFEKAPRAAVHYVIRCERDIEADFLQSPDYLDRRNEVGVSLVGGAVRQVAAKGAGREIGAAEQRLDVFEGRVEIVFAPPAASTTKRVRMGHFSG